MSYRQVNKLQVDVNFGLISQNEFNATVSSISAPWITSTSILVASPAGIATADHDPDDYFCDQIHAYCTNIQPGVSFDLVAFAPNGTWGNYLINVLGV